MSKRIYKYRVDDRTPKGAKLLHIDMQDGFPTVWLEVNTLRQLTENRYYCFPTGGLVPEGYRHLKTLFDGPYVWHIYEVQS